MYKMFKLAFKLGYKFAERHYYQKLTSNIKSHYESEYILDSTESPEWKKQKVELQRALLREIDEAFRSKKEVSVHTYTTMPFDDDITKQL